MENNYDNTPKENDSSSQSAAAPSAGQLSSDMEANRQPDKGADMAEQQYTDPNAGEPQDHSRQYPYNTGQNGANYNQQNSGYQYGQNNGYNYNQNYNQNYSQYQNYNQNGSYNYQDNYSYNTGNQHNQMYEPSQDTSPMSMGDWLLTLLAAMIPCVGIIFYIVWAFSKTTNVNRRNFCRAQLIIMGVVLVIYLIFIALFGSMLFSAANWY